MARKKMTEFQFEKWWFEKGGEQTAFDKFENKITEKDIKRQPSWKLKRNKEDAITEAVWEKAKKYFVKRKLNKVI